MERREFIRKLLSRTGIGLGAAAAVTGGLIGYYQPRKEFYGDADLSGSDRLASPRKAVVVGGGLAGMSASLELARKGFEVTLVESSPDLGGKLTGWDLEALGRSFPVEHGFHGFFDQYYNLNELFRSAGVSPAVFDAAPGYPVIFRDRPTETYGQASAIFPLNIFTVVAQSQSLDIASIMKHYQGLWPVIDLFRYEYGRNFSRLDGIDFMSWCRQNDILPVFVDTVLHPFADATMNRMEVLSAAEAIRYFHFYFMGSPEGLAFRITNRDCMSAIVDPIERTLERHGVRIMKGRPVSRLTVSGDKVTGVALEGGEAGLLHADSSRVAAEGWSALVSDEGVPLLVRRRGGGFEAFDARCTHMGCPVGPDPGGEGFFCPCHAGRFDESGRAVGGPPEAPLPPLAVAREGSRLVFSPVESSGVAEELLACDYCVLASDVRGIRTIVEHSALGKPAFEASVASLGEADPYAVYRIWLDRPLESAEFPFYTVSGYTYTDSISIYSDFQEPYIGWARESGGAVIELHAYAIAPDDVRSEDETRLAMLEELYRMFPETRGATLLHELFMMQSNFTRWAPGDHARRPGPETPFANLFLAGDWVRVDAPVFLMEAAAFTGRMAANAICRQEGVRPVPLPVVPIDGIFA